MARADQLQQHVAAQNGRKKFLQQITFTTSGALTTLATKDVYGVALENGAVLVLQPSADICYEFRNSGALASAVTIMTGIRPGVFVPAQAQEFVYLHEVGSNWGQDLKIDVIGNSAGGSLNIFVVS